MLLAICNVRHTCLTVACPKARLPLGPTGKLGGDTRAEPDPLLAGTGRAPSAGRAAAAEAHGAQQTPWLLTHPSAPQPKPPTLLSRREREAWCQGWRRSAPQPLQELSPCPPRDAHGEAPGSSPALLQGLGLCTSQVLVVTQTRAKPLPWWALGKWTPHYHLLPPQFTLSVGCAGIPLPAGGAAQWWQEVPPTGHQKPLAVPMCPFSDNLDGKKGLGQACGAEGSACPKLQTLQGRPCPGGGAAGAVRLLLSASGCRWGMGFSACPEQKAEPSGGRCWAASRERELWKLAAPCRACSLPAPSRSEQAALAREIPEADCESSENKTIFFARERSRQERPT